MVCALTETVKPSHAPLPSQVFLNWRRKSTVRRGCASETLDVSFTPAPHSFPTTLQPPGRMEHLQRHARLREAGVCAAS